MNIQFNLSNGQSITANIPDFNSAEFATKLNDNRTQFITIGNNGFQKHMLATWNEVPAEPTA